MLRAQTSPTAVRLFPVVQTGLRDFGNGGEDACIQRPNSGTEAPDGAETEPGGHQGEMLGKPQPVHL